MINRRDSINERIHRRKNRERVDKRNKDIEKTLHDMFTDVQLVQRYISQLESSHSNLLAACREVYDNAEIDKKYEQYLEYAIRQAERVDD